MARIFLSYDHEDMGLAKPIAEALERDGHTVWYDRHIQGGAQYSHKIEQALDDADVVVVLWSKHSLESAWVRDEAADGRDRGKLVPLKVGGVTVPIGFRQFQTIDLGAWKGRGKIPNFDRLIDAVESQSETSESNASPALAPGVGTSSSARPRRGILIAPIAALIVAGFGFGAWKWFGGHDLPVVGVVAADKTPASQAAASDLFVKLGSLAQVGQGKWQLVDAGVASGKPDFTFKTGDTSVAGMPQSSLILLDGHDNSLLWSRDFAFPAGGGADLKQHLSLTAGRVLGCALESRAAGGLPRDLLRLFLTACSQTAEISNENPERVTVPLRSIVTAMPKFAPAWSRLIYADIGLVSVSTISAGDDDSATALLRRDMALARRAAPDLPELKLADASLLAPADYGRQIALLREAAAAAPDKPEVLLDLSAALGRAGFMFEASDVAKRAAELDPLSPTAASQLVMAYGYSGQFDQARKALATAEQLWAGTGALRDAQWAYALRYGDPKTAKQYASFGGEGNDLYLAARADPSPAKVKIFIDSLHSFLTDPNPGIYSWTVQGFAEFNQIDLLFDSIGRMPTNEVAASSYILFRPAFAGAHRDPRFMQVMKRIGLTKYWRTSNKWPDFCEDSKLTYNCQAWVAQNG